jgi:hypothetical protein
MCVVIRNIAQMPLENIKSNMRPDGSGKGGTYFEQPTGKASRCFI